MGSKRGATSESAMDETQMSDTQDQSATGGSTAVQAGRDVIFTNTTTGLTFMEARQIAKDVFDANFIRLADEAASIAASRADALRERFFVQLGRENPEGLQQAKDPGFQHAFYTAQKEQARTGDTDLGDLLVDLLVDRTKHSERDIRQIVLDESLNTAPKLTGGQIATLSSVFFLRYTRNRGVTSHAELGRYLDKFVEPLITKLATSNASFQHLEFTGCGAVGAFEWTPEQNLESNYQGLFLKGFDPAEIANRAISTGLDRRVFMACLNDPSKLQVAALNQEQLELRLSSLALPAEDTIKIKELFNAFKMSHEEIRAKCIEIRPYMETIFDVWANSSMKNFTLTSVGIAIGHANIKRIIGEEFADLSIWIN